MFSAASTGGFILIFLASRGAPHVEIWSQTDWAFWIPNVAPAISTVLMVCGYTDPDLTATGQESTPRDDSQPKHGIISHPALWAIGLWALAQPVVNIEATGILLFGGLAFLRFGDMSATHAKERTEIGAR